MASAEAQAERAWMRLSTIQRQEHDKAVCIAESVQRSVRRYAGHSLRAGFVTSAAAAGARVDEIMDHTGHTRVDTLTRYIRNAKDVHTSAAAKLVCEASVTPSDEALPFSKAWRNSVGLVSRCTLTDGGGVTIIEGSGWVLG